MKKENKKERKEEASLRVRRLSNHSRRTLRLKPNEMTENKEERLTKKVEGED